MSFKENLLKKIRIKTLAERVLASLGTPDSGKKLDRNAMRGLMEMAGFSFHKERDLELYLQDTGDEAKRIMVLGNELAFFRASVADVAMRRSPTVKEMISIRNAVKILNDKDIVISKGEDTVKIIREECLDGLDLTFNESDLDEIAQEGIASLENSYAEGITEALMLFAELLDYQEPPKDLRLSHCRMFGRLDRPEKGRPRFGPMVVYGMVKNELKFVDEPISVLEKESVEYLESVIDGRIKAHREGPDAFWELKRRVLQNSE